MQTQLQEKRQMSYSEIRQLFRDYQTQYEWLQPYELQFNNAKRRLGYHSIRDKVISISNYHMQGSEYHTVLDTLLHEMAHALTHYRYPNIKIGHGYQWQVACRQLGAQPNRLKPAGVVYTIEKPQAKYTLKCPNCGRISYMHKKSSKSYACTKCCREHSNGRYDARFKFVVTQNW